MKRLYRIFNAVLSLSLCALFLCACSSAADPAPTATPTETPVVTPDTPENWVVIRADGDIDKAVVRAATKIRSTLQIEISNDYSVKAEDNRFEILVGETNRPESAAAKAMLQEDGYAIVASGRKIAIVGCDSDRTAYAADYFLEHCTDSLSTSAYASLYVTGTYIPPFDYENPKTKTFSYDNIVKGESLAASSDIFRGELLWFNLYDAVNSLSSRDSVAAFDLEFAVVALQGLCNREAPRLFVRNRPQDNGNTDQWVDGIEADNYWLTIYMSDGRYLSGASVTKITYKTGKETDALLELLERNAGVVDGLVVWDEAVPATMLAAATAAGVENLLPVRGDGVLYELLTKAGYEVKLDLRNRFTGEKGSAIWGTSRTSTGSAKNDTYIWAMETYLKQGKTSTDYIALTRDGLSYSDDTVSYQAPHNTVLANFDFLIAKRAFFFSLLTWDAVAADEPTVASGTDYATVNEILQEQYELAKGNQFNGFYQVSGWIAVNDVQNSKDGTNAEWTTKNLLSTWHGAIEMEGGGFNSCANTSVYMHIPQLTAYEQTASVIPEDDYNPDKKYVAFYMGDYDSVAWATNVIPAVWESEGRGKLPLAWGIGGMQGERAVHVYNYLYQTATENDTFVAIDNGIGYLNPQFLLKSNIESPYAKKIMSDGIEEWASINAALYEKYDLDCTPFLIPNWQQDPSPSTALGKVLQKYTAFSAGGLGFYTWANWGIGAIQGENTVPLVKTFDGANNLSTFEQVYDNLLGYLQTDGNGQNLFLIREVIVDPLVLYRAVLKVQAEHPEIDFEVVDIHTFYSYAAIRASIDE